MYSRFSRSEHNLLARVWWPGYAVACSQAKDKTNMAEPMEDDVNVSQRLEQCFQDIDNLLCACDQERNTTLQHVIEE